MEPKLTIEDRNRIKESIRQKYAEVSVNPEGFFRYPTGRAGLEALSYPPEIIQALPKAVASSYCGVGNPFTLGRIHKGEKILDIGCGGGADTLVAAMMVGPKGKLVGIDLVPEMVERAIENLRITPLSNVSFEEASAEDLPFPDANFDVVISNGVFNLIPNKMKALGEVLRVLKPLGRFMIADQVLTVEPPGDTRSRVESWFR
jgi:SAM-dependent methyltransferase